MKLWCCPEGVNPKSNPPKNCTKFLLFCLIHKIFYTYLWWFIHWTLTSAYLMSSNGKSNRYDKQEMPPYNLDAHTANIVAATKWDLHLPCGLCENVKKMKQFRTTPYKPNYAIFACNKFIHIWFIEWNFADNLVL